MASTEDSGISTTPTEVPRPYSQLTYTQQAYVDWKALNGVITDEDGVSRKVRLPELAAMCHVTEDAFSQAKRSLPNFWELVAERRTELGGQNRLAQMHALWYLNALKMKNWQLTEAWLRNFDPDYREPKQKVEHELGNSWMALIQAKRGVIEGEVVDGPSAD